MSERFEQLEAELAAMRPRALPPALGDRIEAELAATAQSTRATTSPTIAPRPSPWPDRFLLSAIGSGAIAACVIVAMLAEPNGNGAFPSPPPVVAKTAASDPPRAGTTRSPPPSAARSWTCNPREPHS